MFVCDSDTIFLRLQCNLSMTLPVEWFLNVFVRTAYPSAAHFRIFQWIHCPARPYSLTTQRLTSEKSFDFAKSSNDFWPSTGEFGQISVGANGFYWWISDNHRDMYRQSKLFSATSTRTWTRWAWFQVLVDYNMVLFSTFGRNKKKLDRTITDEYYTYLQYYGFEFVEIDQRRLREPI